MVTAAEPGQLESQVEPETSPPSFRPMSASSVMCRDATVERRAVQPEAFGARERVPGEVQVGLPRLPASPRVSIGSPDPGLDHLACN
jgi:hypothetical protein